ncbi:polycomb group protein Psc-like isoform X2 [Homalodisca vitripennis]|uniref:polycomb group protein Psc-like isoform X2 n=1 Tax=Homalodisca vitripennis TaxID=197043 RepID=UPI001EEC6132|nr:polycomb group protein Psc-like isoform X2 [Homalodisca vitripennis]
MQAPPLPQQPRGRVRLTEVNPHLVCVLCHGYFIDATTMAECPHSFCRSCIVLYLETKSYCPICEVQIHKTKPHLNLKPDKTLQDIVYKLVPGLFHDEMRRRRAFYAKYPNRDLYLSPEARGVGVERIIYSPEDSISLSIEYYDDDREREEWAPTRPGSCYDAAAQPQPSQSPTPACKDGLKRYLQCPAAVNMRLLKKFIRLKFGLSQACTVEILYRRESLPDSYSLMDIAYIYTWKRNGPMRFYYRIQVPTPMRTELPCLTPSSEPIRDSVPGKLKSPELLDAVGLRPIPPAEAVTIQPMETNLEVKAKKDAPEKEGIPKVEERPKTTLADDTAVSLLLALSNGHGGQEQQKEAVVVDSKQGQASAEPETCPPPTPTRPSNANGGVFKVPQSMTKRFVINGGKLVAVKNKQPGGKSSKSAEKTKVNGKTVNVESSYLGDRFTNPLGLVSNGPLGVQGGRLPPGSPRPPPNSERVMKTKYMTPSGLLVNRLTPEITLSQNKPVQESIKPPQISSNQMRPVKTQVKPNGHNRPTSNGQPPHRKETNRLEQIVQNCLKKGVVSEVFREKRS